MSAASDREHWTDWTTTKLEESHRGLVGICRVLLVSCLVLLVLGLWSNWRYLVLLLVSSAALVCMAMAGTTVNIEIRRRKNEGR